MSADPFERFVTIASFSSIAEARVAQSTLDSFGIDSHLSDEATIGLQWSYAPALGGVKLLVRGEESIWAIHYLQKTAEPLDDDAISEDDEECPRCGSLRVYPIEARRKIGTVLMLPLVSIPIAVMAIFFPPFRTLLASDSECKACGNRW